MTPRTLYVGKHGLGTAPLSNSWIIIIIGFYIALSRTPNIDCYWVGAVPKPWYSSVPKTYRVFNINNSASRLRKLRSRTMVPKTIIDYSRVSKYAKIAPKH